MFDEPLAGDKLLTIVVFGRNDNYSGNFKYRLTTCLNFIGDSARKIQRQQDVEVLVVDWNSDSPLCNDLPLSDDTRKITRFVVVPPNIAAQSMTPGQVFHSAIAPNVGLRRGSGVFRMLIPADVLITSWAMQSLLTLLDGSIPLPFDIRKAICMCGRAFLPMRICDQQLTVAEWERFIILTGGQMFKEYVHPFLGGGHAGQLLHCDLWEECCGNDESLGKWGWSDSDLTLRLTQGYPNIDLSAFGVVFYEISHLTVSYRQTRTNGNPHVVNPALSMHNPDWGIGDQDLSIIPADQCASLNVSEESPPKPADAVYTPCSKRSLLKTLIKVGSCSRFSRDTLRYCSFLHKIGTLGSARSFLEIGAYDVHHAGFWGLTFPGSEIYLIPEMADFSKRIDDFEAFAWHTMRKNYIRVVAGSLATGIQRLNSSWVGIPRLDVIMLHTRAFDAMSGLAEQITKALTLLSKTGVLIIVCSAKNPPSFIQELLSVHQNLDVRQDANIMIVAQSATVQEE